MLTVQPSDFPRLLPDLEIAIFRIVQEALTNIFRHSGATNAKVTLLADTNRVVVSVLDDGKGVSDLVVKFRPGGVGVGIAGMRQRIKEFGGELWLTNTNPGTLVEAAVPIKCGVASSFSDNGHESQSHLREGSTCQIQPS